MREDDLLNVDYIRSRLAYDPETGLLRWKPIPVARWQDKAWNTHYAGNVAGVIHRSPSGNEYFRVFLDKKHRAAHRLIWLIVTGEWPPCDIDHVDNCGTNNIFANLRLAMQRENGWNRKRPSTNTSGYKGVRWVANRQKWRAYIYKHPRCHSLGHFRTLEEAVEARRKAAINLHGEFASFQGDADQ